MARSDAGPAAGPTAKRNMQREAFAALAELEDYHWWFEGRRRIIASMLRRLPLPPSPRILEAGCGSGGSLPMLSTFGSVWGMEPDPEARRLAAERGCATVADGSFPDAVSFPGSTFDVIGLFDVLEHLDDDVAALRSLLPRFAPGGHLMLAVPAFPFLFGPHDVLHAHRQRYTVSILRERLAAAGYRLVHWSYFNFWLFAPTALIRLLQRRRPPSGHDDLRMSPGLFNGLFTRLLSSEGPIVTRLSVPFGLSLLVVAQRIGD